MSEHGVMATSRTLRVIGVDPGPTPGLVRLHCQNGRLVPDWTHVVQCTANALPEIVGAFLDNGRDVWPSTVVQVERFVTRGRTNSAQRQTLDQVGFLQSIADVTGAAVVLRNASQVKAWATDARLEAAGLLEACKGMRHARDAARHALYAAVHDGAIPDPLSKAWPQ